MRIAFSVVAGFLTAVAACVGDDPLPATAPPTDGGGLPVQPGSDASQPPAAFCSSVPPAANANESVFCEDFEGDYESNWSSTSEAGTLSTAVVDGSKVLEVALSASSATSYTGPRLLWRKIPRAGAAEVSFDFMLLEAPRNPSTDGLLWFARIGALGSASIGFGAQLRTQGIDYAAIFSAGAGELASEATFSFAPKQWTRVKLRYTTTTDGADQLVSVGTNPEYAASLTGSVDLLDNDVVFLGIFVKGAPAVVRARFDNVVIRVTKP
jgi:hypothetical protein